jgi:uncharacterized protein (UPF0276 family)
LSRIGLGLRWEFADELLARRPAEIDFLEIAPENYMGRGGRARRTFERACASYPILTHGLSMSLGGSDPLDAQYLDDLRALALETGTPWHSDHACMTSEGGRVLHDLLPLPLSRETAAHVATRVREAQDRLGVPMAIENVSFYLRPGGELTEPQFIREICERADCKWLFDVNNAVVNAQNFGLDVDAWLREAPMERIVQLHVAGHEWFDFQGGELHPRGAVAPGSAPEVGADRLIVDTHGAAAQPPVLALLEAVLRRAGPDPIPIVIERDQNIPPIDALLEEVARVRAVAERAALRQ